MELLKTPMPEPSVVLLFAMVGFAEILQQTPRAITEALPPAVILPPLCAVAPVMKVTAVVVKMGRTGVVVVVKLTSLP